MEPLRSLLVLLLAGLLAAACSDGSGGLGSALAEPTETSRSGDDAPSLSGPQERNLAPYEGLGAWVDVFDYAPAYGFPGAAAAVTPDTLGTMAALGVETLYLQAARLDERSPGVLADDTLTPRLLVAAHEAGIRVVAWYLPKLAPVSADVEKVQALLDFEVDGHRFDGVALDIEDTLEVPAHAERSRRLARLSERIDEVADGEPLGAIVLPPVLLEVVNDKFWPSFPWRAIAGHYDVWLPMTYWTNRAAESGYRDGYTYADESIRRMRANLGDSEAPIHPIGGVADESTPDDYRDFVRAATQHGALGWSVYDFTTQSSASWSHLVSMP